VVVARERALGRTIPWVVGRESDAVPMIRQNVASGTEVHADESGAWNILHASFPMKRVNHSVEFKSEDGGCTNEAESYFSRLRRCEFGIHHRISGQHLQAYAREIAWREDKRRVANGTQWKWIISAALAHPKSATWAGYWHREKAA
jgi:ISXO2-like transposase domain